MARSWTPFASIALFCSTFLMAGLAGCAATASPHGGLASQVVATQARQCESLPSAEHATIVIFEPSAARKLVCNEPRSRERFVPASTFKIPHMLLALQSGVVADEHQRFAWDGRQRGVGAWDKDLSLSEAIQASAVWVFQEVAETAGWRAEAAWVDELEYGNRSVGAQGELRHFWLSGPLTISAQEQVDFLVRMRSDRLPVKSDVVTRTSAALRLADAGNEAAVYGKTGAMLPIDDQGFLHPDRTGLLPEGVERTGWFVGWIERPADQGGPVFFALNLDLELPDAMAARTKAAYDILAANGYPAPVAAR